MTSYPNSGDIIPSTVPDCDIPVEKVIMSAATGRNTPRKNRFLRGPLSLAFLRQHIRDPADRLLLVLLAYSDMNRSKKFKITAALLKDAGVENRKTSYRALKTLEAQGILEVERNRGCRPVVLITADPRQPRS